MNVTIKLYRPSNGTEGESFHAHWCERCARDLWANGTKATYDECEPHEVCAIIGNTLAFDIYHPDYSKEWRYVDGVPTCTAFVPKGSPLPTPAELEAAGQERLPL